MAENESNFTGKEYNKGEDKQRDKEKKISNLIYNKSIEFEKTTEDFYTLRKSKGNINTDTLDKIMSGFFESEKQPNYVFVTGELKKDDHIIYVSDSFNYLAYQDVIDSDEYGEGNLFYEALMLKLGANIQYSGYELINVHVRVIYH